MLWIVLWFLAYALLKCLPPLLFSSDLVLLWKRLLRDLVPWFAIALLMGFLWENYLTQIPTTLLVWGFVFVLAIQVLATVSDLLKVLKRRKTGVDPRPRRVLSDHLEWRHLGPS